MVTIVPSYNSCKARTQPCLTPLVRVIKMEMKTSGQPNLAMFGHRPSLHTVSNALVRSTNTGQRATLFFVHLFCNFSAAKIMSTVSLLALKSHQLSVRGPCIQPIEQDFRKNFSCNGQQGDVFSIIFSILSVTFPFIHVPNGCIFEVWWQNLLFHDQLKKLSQIFKQYVPTFFFFALF